MLSPNPSAFGMPQGGSGSTLRQQSLGRPTGSRASSREQPINTSVDPLLARYLSIKRDLDKAAVVSSAPTTPRSTTELRQAIQSGEAAKSTLLDARSILTSPMSSTPPPTNRASNQHAPPPPPPGGIQLSDRLNARLESRQQRQSSALQHSTSAVTSTSMHADAINSLQTSSVASGVNATEYSVTSLRNLNDTSASLVPAGGDSMVHQYEREIEQLAVSAAESELAKSRAEARLEQKEAELQQYRQQQQYSASARELAVVSRQESVATAKHQLLLQGKVEALEVVVAEKDAMLDEEQRRVFDLERRNHELSRQMESLQLALYSKDRAVGEVSASIETERREVERYRGHAEEANRQLREERRQIASLQEALEDKRIEIEKLQIAHRDALREANRQHQEAEMSSVAIENEMSTLRSAKLSLEDRVEELQHDVSSLRTQLQDTTSKLEGMRTLSAQESIVNDELKYEVDRYKKVAMDLREELVSQEQSRKHLESIMGDLKADCDAKASVESQLRTVTQNAETLTLEVEGLRGSLEDCRRRLAEAREETEGIPKLEDHIAELKASVQGHKITIEKLYIREKDSEKEIERLKQLLREADDREQPLIQEITNLQDSLVRQERLCHDRECEINELKDLFNVNDKLRVSIDEKTRYIVQQQDIIDDLRRKNEELDADVETLLSVKRHVDELAVERQDLLHQLSHQEAEIAELHREASSGQLTIKQKESEVRDLRELIASLEAQVVRLNSQLQDRSNLDMRLKGLAAELSAKTDELQKEKYQKDDLTMKLSAKEELRSEQARRLSELESQVTSLHRELAQSQVEQGRLGVMVESQQREKQRIVKENEVKTAMLDQANEELASARREMQQARLELHSFQTREKLESERSATSGAQQRHLEEEAERLKARVRSLEEDLSRKEIATAELRTAQDREKALAERHEELNVAVRRKEEELRSALQQVQQLKEKMRDLQNDASQTSRLEARLQEAKQQTEKQSQLLETLEREDNNKSRLLIDKEREMSRLRERITSLNSEVESERNRKKQFEGRIRELETECQRSSALDGQVAGLNLVIAQRTKDLEEERSINSELRSKLRQSQADRSSSQRSTAPTAELESKLQARDSTIRQLEDDLRRSAARCEALTEELRQSEARRDSALLDARKATEERLRSEAALVSKCERLERSLDVAKRSAESEKNVNTLRTNEELVTTKQELLAAQRKLTELTQSLEAKGREVELLRQQQQTTTRSSSELYRTREHLREAEEMLQEKASELEIANENLSTLQSRLREEIQRNANKYPSVDPHSGEEVEEGRPSSIAPLPTRSHTSPHRSVSSSYESSAVRWDIASAEETIQQWREKRKQQMEQEKVAAAEYDNLVRSRLPQITPVPL